MRKLLLSLLLLTILILGSVSISYADAPIKVQLDGKDIAFDVPPSNINGRTLVPLRAIFEAFGAEVTWDAATKTVTGTKSGTQIQLQVNNKTAQVNGKSVQLDVPAMNVNNRVLVPTRFIAESLGTSVVWDAASRTVVIQSQNTNGNSLYAIKTDLPICPVEDQAYAFIVKDLLPDEIRDRVAGWSTSGIGEMTDEEFVKWLYEDFIQKEHGTFFPEKFNNLQRLYGNQTMVMFFDKSGQPIAYKSLTDKELNNTDLTHKYVYKLKISHSKPPENLSDPADWGRNLMTALHIKRMVDGKEDATFIWSSSFSSDYVKAGGSYMTEVGDFLKESGSVTYEVTSDVVTVEAVEYETL